MSNSQKFIKRFPWQKISVVALILIIVAGIYIFKNSSSNENNQITQDDIATQSDTSSDGNASAQATSTESTESTSSSSNSTKTNKALPKLVDLGASTCIPCKEMAPILAELKKEYKGIVDVEIVDVYEDVAKTNEYNEKHPISLIPTQILFDANGKEVWSHEGSLPKEELIQIFKDKVGVK